MRPADFSLVGLFAIAAVTLCGPAAARAQGGKADGAPAGQVKPAGGAPTLDLGGGVTLELIAIPAGEFTMGSPASEAERNTAGFQEKQHLRKVAAFQMGKYEVTKKQWLAVMGEVPRRAAGEDNMPVTNISYHEARMFCDRVSQIVKRSVRLPWEAEWEYACRAGSTTAFCFGDDPAGLGEYAWFRGNYDARQVLRPVGGRKPNAWGLHDMHGSVTEWCMDWAEAYKEGDSSVVRRSPKWGEGPAVKRGGDVHSPSGFCRAAARASLAADQRNEQTGFRIVVDAEPWKDSARAAPPAGEKPLVLDLGGGVTMELRAIPAGEFMMGAPDNEDGRRKDEKQHKRKVTRAFHIGKYEVTQKQWQALMGGNPTSLSKGDDLPVTDVHYADAQAFCAKLSQKCQKVARLPWEAEWEYVCRAGSTTRYCWGDEPGELKYYGWFNDNSGGLTHRVGLLRPNPWGVYDLYGNAREWCQDWSQRDVSALSDEQGPPEAPAQERRVVRGAGIVAQADEFRSAARNSEHPNSKNSDLGFRVVIDAEQYKGPAPEVAAAVPAAPPAESRPAAPPKPAAPDAPAVPGSPAPGTYAIASRDGAGATRQGKAVVERKGVVYGLSFDYEGGPKLQGVGIGGVAGGNDLWVAYGTPQTAGLAVYRINGGKLEGIWYPWYAADGDEKNLGAESLAGPESLSGEFTITTAKAPKTGVAYTGKVTIAPTHTTLEGDGKAYTLTWSIAGATYKGVGLRVKDHLIVSSGTGAEFAVARFRVEGEQMSGESFSNTNAKGAHTMKK